MNRSLLRRALEATLRFHLCYSEISTCASVCQRSVSPAYLPATGGRPCSQLSHSGPGEAAGRGQAGAAVEESGCVRNRRFGIAELELGMGMTLTSGSG